MGQGCHSFGWCVGEVRGGVQADQCVVEFQVRTLQRSQGDAASPTTQGGGGLQTKTTQPSFQ